MSNVKETEGQLEYVHVPGPYPIWKAIGRLMPEVENFVPSQPMSLAEKLLRQRWEA